MNNLVKKDTNGFIMFNEESCFRTFNSLVNGEKDVIIQSDAKYIDSEEDNMNTTAKMNLLVLDSDSNNELTSRI
ncbi:hypothetical protein Glove_116g46 [Diversispora epigaea]|uniref:Uncharacterized protein n=1 Tax=Diversispora epigaea TaxID=1348612 RepID=A0A397JAD1_9GLOM|nr:hypothetical protein Glove_116g46 [Diversispora epigaea]